VRGPFVNIPRTGDELSVIGAAEQVPAGVRVERDWRLLKVLGPFPLTTIGALASSAAPLAGAGISLLAVANHDPDYVLVKAQSFDLTMAVLFAAGHRPAS